MNADIFPQHIKDLSKRAESRNRFVFSDFLTPDEQSTVLSFKKELCEVSFFGGVDGCERVMARFGSVSEMGYEVPFPIATIKISPLNIRFAEELTHRDCLGAVMSLGLERSQIGDIVMRDKCCYMFVCENKSEYICNELKKIRHTDIQCEITSFDDSEPLFKTLTKTVIISSDRLDCVISGVFNMSRSDCSALFEGGKIFVNGRQILSPSFRPDDGDTVSVRGHGKFIFHTPTTQTKKGRLVVDIEIFA